jgi:hypothetical protein
MNQNEKNLSAFKNTPRQNTWFFGANENTWWKSRHQRKTSQRTQTFGGLIKTGPGEMNESFTLLG